MEFNDHLKEFDIDKFRRAISERSNLLRTAPDEVLLAQDAARNITYTAFKQLPEVLYDGLFRGRTITSEDEEITQHWVEAARLITDLLIDIALPQTNPHPEN